MNTMTDKKKIGEIFVENGTITEKTLQRALEKAKKEGKKIGYILEDMGVVTGEEVADALANQYGYQKVSKITSCTFARDLLDLVSVDIALRYLLFPLKKDGNKLDLAMADPTDTKIVSNMAKNNNLAITSYVATRAEIIAAINKHYLGKDPATERRKTVLIVEDNVLASSEAEFTLSREGYRVITANDGIKAFKKAITESPHVILTDKEMPGFDGYRLLESLKSLPETGHIPVILLTASSNEEEEAEAYKKGFFDFMAKPVKDVTLITRVKRAIDTFERVHRFD